MRHYCFFNQCHVHQATRNIGLIVFMTSFAFLIYMAQKQYAGVYHEGGKKDNCHWGDFRIGCLPKIELIPMTIACLSSLLLLIGHFLKKWQLYLPFIISTIVAVILIFICIINDLVNLQDSQQNSKKIRIYCEIGVFFVFALFYYYCIGVVVDGMNFLRLVKYY
ncbi:unnamed protein product [Bursaphelenchus xylophilus]|uniref:(pine wood nematode) hypothetical protein n=1 Tax=Bursaphelenchus xylophilus TaxID=6326 RepID=A0A1I7SB21_BURXY|nr:unnamed protein product [Bursaphelenchus xylophilus]CAG9131699.1 unnamed protein product [Bursaphelenchus xylophilus]